MSDVKLAIRKIKSFSDVHCPNLNPDVRKDYCTTTQMICGEIQRLTALVEKYEKAIREHKEYTESLYGRNCTAADLKLWKTLEN